MKSLPRSLCALVVLFVLVLPGSAAAQTADETRLQLLQELVAVLEAQLALLQAEVAAPTERHLSYPIDEAVFYDEDSLLDDIEAEVVARYQVRDMDIISPAATHEQYIARMAELIPEEYHDKYVEFVVFESDNKDIDAFVETTLPYKSQWRYGVSVEAVEESVSSDSNTELMVHEFGHLFSLHEVFTNATPATCHEYFAGHGGCVSSDTIYGAFLAEFWDDERLDRTLVVQEARNFDRALRDFYRDYEDEFVSDYAASSPAEDFAESFAHFVLYDDEEYGDIANEKVSFFNRFSYPYGLRQEILSDL